MKTVKFVGSMAMPALRGNGLVGIDIGYGLGMDEITCNAPSSWE